MAPNDGVDIAGTVRERAARELRDRILTGALPAGTRLDLDANSPGLPFATADGADSFGRPGGPH